MKVTLLLRMALLCPIFLCSITAACQNYLVINQNAEGDGSFTAALKYANDHDGPDTIRFDISGEGPFYLETGTPVWDGQTVIDGTSQTNYYLGLIVVGTDENTWKSLYVFGDNSEIYGLAAKSINFDGADNFRIGSPDKGNLLHQINLENSNDGKIQSNIIGTNAAGTIGLSTEGSGITSMDSDDLLIGGSLPNTGNLISGKEKHGLELIDPKNFLILNNKIGTDITGTYAIPNQENGIYAVVHGPITIGLSTETGNLISGNLGNGISTISIANSESLIAGNKIGTDITGTQAVPNGNRGMQISGGTPVRIRENIVAFHPNEAIYSTNIVRLKLVRENSLFCNEGGGYITDIEDKPSLDSISMHLIKGIAPANNTVDIYYGGNDLCNNSPCQEKLFIGTSTSDVDGNWELEGNFELGYYMATATSSEEITSSIGDCVLLEEIVNLSDLSNNSFQVFQNEPNPFQDKTQISFYLPYAEFGIFKVFDQLGKLVYYQEKYFDAGEYSIQLSSNELKNSGVFFYNFQTANFSQSAKMIKR